MNVQLPIALVCVAALGFACGPRTRSETRSEPRGASGAAQQAPTTVRRGEALRPTLAVRIQDEVRFDFNVINDGAKKLELTFPSGRTHEIVVLDTLGREVWRWSDGRMFTQSMQARVLRSSDALELDGAWTDPLPGKYVAVATLASDNHPLRTETGFTIP